MSDVHQHYCRQCRRPWEHDGAQLHTDAAIRRAHKCPVCGTPGWTKFYGTETHEQMCELEALLETSEDMRLPADVREKADHDFAVMASRLHRPNCPVPAGRSGARTAPPTFDELLAFFDEL